MAAHVKGWVNWYVLSPGYALVSHFYLDFYDRKHRWLLEIQLHQQGSVVRHHVQLTNRLFKGKMVVSTSGF